MRSFTEAEIRASFVNGSKGEAKRAGLPDLAAVRWGNLDFLGWADPKQGLQAYVTFAVEDQARTILLRQVPAPKDRRKLMCSWCQDITATDNVSFYAAPLAGPRGRRGDTVATSICTDFSWAKNVRRVPGAMEVQNEEDRAAWQKHRIASLTERSLHFLALVTEEG